MAFCTKCGNNIDGASFCTSCGTSAGGNVNSSPAAELYNQASALYEQDGPEEKNRKAFELYVKAAEMGYAPAQYEVGEFYYYGISVSGEDMGKAKYWYSKAAAQGHAEAQFALSRL